MLVAESIEWFIEGQAFSRSYDLDPRPPPPPSLVRKTEKDNLLTGEGEGGGRGAESSDGPSKNNSLLFGWL
jgi:hypothetical protein